MRTTQLTQEKEEFVYVPPRQATAEDLEVLSNLGYPDFYLENGAEVVIKTCSSGPNKGREFWSFQRLFEFWDDERKRFDEKEYERKVEKRKRDTEIFTESKRLKTEFDYKKQRDVIKMQRTIEELMEEVIELRKIVDQLENENSDLLSHQILKTKK